MSSEAIDGRLAAAAEQLRLLNDQADSVRAELVHLRAEMAAAKNEFSKLRATTLAQTSEELVVAAAHADTVAEFAVSSLGELNLVSQLDELTGLPTRSLLLDRLDNAMNMARRRGTRVGVVFLDLDHFKNINDTLGHAVGDQILQLATTRLQAVVRDSDTVSRHGGDEFILLFPEIVWAADLAPLAEKIVAALAEPALVAGQTVRMSATAGIAVFPEDGNDAATLLNHADAAMYRGKQRGRGHYEFHSEAPAGVPRSTEALPPLVVARRTPAVFAEHEAHLHALRGANHELLEAARNDQKMRAHAEHAHQRQINFVAMAAHAMRTPLTSLRLNLTLMKRDDGSASSERIDTLEQQIRQLARLIDDLLDGSLVGGGEFKLDCVDLQIDSVLDAAVDTCRQAMESKRQTLHIRRLARPVCVHGDAMRLTQLFSSLLKNASRRAPEGGDVWLSAASDGERAVFEVSDNGAMLKGDALEQIFELYALDSSLHQEDVGLGIGLAVALELTQAHGGSIVARNTVDPGGCQFVVTLPCRPQ